MNLHLSNFCEGDAPTNYLFLFFGRSNKPSTRIKMSRRFRIRYFGGVGPRFSGLSHWSFFAIDPIEPSSSIRCIIPRGGSAARQSYQRFHSVLIAALCPALAFTFSAACHEKMKVGALNKFGRGGGVSDGGAEVVSRALQPLLGGPASPCRGRRTKSP